MEELPYELYEPIVERLYGYKLKELSKLSKAINKYTIYKLWSRLTKDWPDSIYQKYGCFAKQINYDHLKDRIRNIERYSGNIKLMKFCTISEEDILLLKKHSLLDKISKIKIITRYNNENFDPFIVKRLYFKKLIICNLRTSFIANNQLLTIKFFSHK